MSSRIWHSPFWTAKKTPTSRSRRRLTSSREVERLRRVDALDVGVDGALAQLGIESAEADVTLEQVLDQLPAARAVELLRREYLGPGGSGHSEEHERHEGRPSGRAWLRAAGVRSGFEIRGTQTRLGRIIPPMIETSSGIVRFPGGSRADFHSAPWAGELSPVVTSYARRPTNGDDSMADFHFQELFELGHDETPYRKLTDQHVSTLKVDGREILKIEPEALTLLAAQAIRDVSHLFRPGHLAQLAKILEDPEASDNDRFVALELMKNANVSAGMILPSCQDTGTAIVMGKKGQDVWVAGNDEEALSRGIHKTYTETNLRYCQLAPLEHVRREEHGHEPAGPDRSLRDDGRRVQVPLHHQGRRLGQQVAALPGDEGPPQSRVDQEVLPREDQAARHRRLPALSPRHRDRRHLGRDDAQDREARELSLPRSSADLGQRPRPRLPRRRARGGDPAADARGRHRRPVRRQVLLPRRARDPPAAPRRVVPGRDRRLVLGRPPDPRQDHEEGRLPRAARDRSGALHARSRGPRADARAGEDRPEPADGGDPRGSLAVPGDDAAPADGHDHRRPRHRPREAEGAPRSRRGAAAVLQGSHRLLRRPGEDAAGLRLGLLRPDDGGAHGRLRRSLPGSRAARWSCSRRAIARSR